MARQHYIDPDERDLQKSKDKKMVLAAAADSSSESGNESGSHRSSDDSNDEVEADDEKADLSSPNLSDTSPDEAKKEIPLPTVNPSPNEESMDGTEESSTTESKEYSNDGEGTVKGPTTKEDKQEKE